MTAPSVNILDGELALPLLVLRDDALSHNIDLMARYCRQRGVSLAPHAKTTMSPQIVARQLDAGAWGITVANVAQALALRGLSAPNVLLANELADNGSLRGFAALALKGDSTYFCLVDSEVGITLLEHALAGAGVSGQPVLLEIGIHGGRAGCRDDAGVLALAERIERSSRIRLAGLELFEGVISQEGLPSTLAAVDAFVGRMRRLTIELDREGFFDGVEQILLSAGGSAFFDRVVEGLGEIASSKPVRVVLRSGCYVTHDCGFYERVSPFGTRIVGQRLRNAVELWACVMSRPEPELAVVGFGKRDAAYDLELPVAIRIRRAGLDPERWERGDVVALNDQHAIMRLRDASVAVGDWLCFGISHPCTALDKWREIPLVDERYDVVGLAETCF